MSDTVQVVGIVVAVLTGIAALLGLVALLIRASGNDARVQKLRADLDDAADRETGLRSQLADVRTELAETRSELGTAQGKITVLDERVLQRAKVEDLTATITAYHAAVVAGLADVHEDLEHLIRLNGGIPGEDRTAP